LLRELPTSEAAANAVPQAANKLLEESRLFTPRPQFTKAAQVLSEAGVTFPENFDDVLACGIALHRPGICSHRLQPAHTVARWNVIRVLTRDFWPSRKPKGKPTNALLCNWRKNWADSKLKFKVKRCCSHLNQSLM